MAKTNHKMPVKLATLDFSEDGYPGFHCKRRLNLPMGVARRITEVETEQDSRDALLAVFPEWDFVDEEGNPIPHTAEGFDLIPADLFTAMLRRGNDALKEAALPANLNGSSSKAPPRRARCGEEAQTAPTPETIPSI